MPKAKINSWYSGIVFFFLNFLNFNPYFYIILIPRQVINLKNNDKRLNKKLLKVKMLKRIPGKKFRENGTYK